jgi:excisionase family DNA binding protein
MQGEPMIHDQAAEKWVTIQELADELGVDVQTVYQWNHRGTAPRRYRFGGIVRYKRSDIDAWIDAHLDLDATGLVAGEQ